MNRVRIGVVLGAALLAAASAAPQQQSGGYGQGTCEGMCSHYFQCKGLNDQQAYGQCVQGCYQEAPDATTMAQYEMLDCASAVAMVDGQGGGGGGYGGAGQQPQPQPQPQQGGYGQPPQQQQPQPQVALSCQSPQGQSPNAQLYNLLTGSAWCSFSYSGTSSGSGGSTSTSRVVFQQDGLVVITTNNESSYSGDGWGTASQNGGGQRACWRIDGSQLMASADGRQYAALPLQIAQNSNGYPIITANGTEYSTCQ
jgi:hypothetical protein